MTPFGDHSAEVRTLVADEPIQPEDRPALMGRLQRLCRAAGRDLRASGVGVSLLSETGSLTATAASSEASARIEELQFALGEGPCLTAFASRRPVLVPDLESTGVASWPGYAPAAREHGVRAVFAFPLQVGVARLGALDVYKEATGELSTWGMSRALSYAAAALETLLDDQRDTGQTASQLTDGSDGRLEVYQAQGMVMVQLGVPADEAMARMRAHAYGRGRRIGDVADDIITRRLVLDPDDPRK